MRKILFLSLYEKDDGKANGFMQLYSGLKNEAESEVGYYQVVRLWQKPVNPFSFRGVLIYFPFLLFKKNIIMAWMYSFNLDFGEWDTVVIDSDPYLVAVSRLLLDRFPGARVVYRQSDPVSWVTECEAVKSGEYFLLESADHILFPNELVSKQYGCVSSNRKSVLNNPIKLVFSELADASLNLDGELLGYDKLGLYYGKFEIDYDLIEKIAKENQSALFVIFGDYNFSFSCTNIRLKGFAPMAVIYEYMKKADFLFIPYLNKGLINKYLYVTAKILSAVLLKKPVLAINVAVELGQLNVKVVSDYSGFSDAISRQSYTIPNIELSVYSEKYFLNEAKSHLGWGK